MVEPGSLKAGDTVRHLTGAEYRVTAVGEKGFLIVGDVHEDEYYEKWVSQRDNYTKVEPFFEVGKTYRFKNGGGGGYTMLRIVEIDGVKIAISKDGRSYNTWKQEDFAAMKEWDA